MYNYLNVCFYFAILCIANYNHLYLVCEGNKSILNLNLNLNLCPSMHLHDRCIILTPTCDMGVV